MTSGFSKRQRIPLRRPESSPPILLRRSCFTLSSALLAALLATLLAGLLVMSPTRSMAEDAPPPEDILVPMEDDSALVESDTTTAASTLLVEYGDGRYPRRETLTDHLGTKFGELDHVVWDLEGELSWDPIALRGKLTWDSLSVSFVVGSRVIHSGERALTMDSPMSHSERGVMYPYPDFLEVLAEVDPEGLRLDTDSGAFVLLPPKPWIRELSQREIGHRYEIRCSLPMEPVAQLHWNGRGILRVTLDGIWGIPRELEISESGEYAGIVGMQATPSGTTLELEVSRLVEGWDTSWDVSDSVWSLVLSTSPREVSQQKLPKLIWESVSSRGRRGPIVVETDLRSARGRNPRRYLSGLGREVAKELRSRLGLRVEEVQTKGGSSSTGRVEAANEERAGLYISLALDEYAGSFPHGISVAVPSMPETDEALREEGTSSAKSHRSGSALLSWEEVAGRHRDAGRYLARLLVATRPDDIPFRIQDRPLADLVGLNMPAVRLYIGRQSPTWDADASFPGDDEMKFMDDVARSIARAVGEFLLAGRREEGL